MVAWLSVRSRGGTVILRIEDLDHPKVKPWATKDTLDDLRWLGFDWDEGPDVGGKSGPYIQSQRLDRYRAGLDKLIAEDIAYPCICTRSEIERCQSAPHEGETLRYDGHCRGRFASYEEALQAAGGRAPAWRFRVQDTAKAIVEFNDLFAGAQCQNVAGYCGDFPIARNSYGAGYALAVVMDDAAMGVTEVVRGNDLLEATPAQILIQRALGLPTPQYCHIPLVVGPDGRRLAKRHGDTRISSFREAGIPPERIIGILAASCGWCRLDEKISLRDLIPRFTLASIPRENFIWANQSI